MTTQLAVKTENLGRKASGFCTPKEDKQPQKMSVPPRRVIPIVFLPGIMGSNLRMSEDIQKRLGKSNNIAWRPDRLSEATWMLQAKPATRQLQLDPKNTVVDGYDGGNASTGNPKETAQARHDVGQIRVTLEPGPDSPLLTDDPPTANPRLRMQDKAKSRGWSEVYFDSYRNVLEFCEQNLNRPSQFSGVWPAILDTDPATWHIANETPLPALTLEDLKKACVGCLFPVHAMGYNWLCSNQDSANSIGKRIDQLIEDYKAKGYKCEKVIVLTHSMGGLVARALVHPAMANRADKVLGIVHGVQPALGAPAAYRRMRCGFEEGALGLNPVPKILGNHGSEVTAVLGNSAGGLQLLPSCAYGNGWLQIQHKGRTVASLPSNGDPYAEIYKVQGAWYGLLREEWLNPAGEEQSGIQQSCDLLDVAKSFHASLGNEYHDQSYCHYGVDANRKSWERVVWQLAALPANANWRDYRIVKDDEQGKLSLISKASNGPHTSATEATLGPSDGPGDQTVPMRSAEAQLLSGSLKGVFRQVGYEHQASYSDTKALHSTLYCIARIAMTMTWCDNE